MPPYEQAFSEKRKAAELEQMREFMEWARQKETKTVPNLWALTSEDIQFLRDCGVKP